MKLSKTDYYAITAMAPVAANPDGTRLAARMLCVGSEMPDRYVQ